MLVLDNRVDRAVDRKTKYKKKLVQNDKELNAEIVVKDAWAPELQRVNDVSLMK